MKVRWREWLLALGIALFLWYGISGTERVETQVELAVDYRGTPPGMIIRGDGLVNKVTVRVKGPVGLIRSISGRTFPFSMDLSSIKKGENVLPVRHGQVRLPLGLEVVEVSPSVIHLTVDSLEHKKLAVEVDITGELPRDMLVQSTVEPKEATVSGPSEVVDSMASLRVSVPLEGEVSLGTTEQFKVLSLPVGVEAKPPTVHVRLTVSLKRKEVQITRKVHSASAGAHGALFHPDRVEITAAIPESLAGRASSSKDIQATVHLGGQKPGEALPVQVTLPPGAELIKVEPAEVVIAAEQR